MHENFQGHPEPQEDQFSYKKSVRRFCRSSVGNILQMRQLPEICKFVFTMFIMLFDKMILCLLRVESGQQFEEKEVGANGFQTLFFDVLSVQGI